MKAWLPYPLWDMSGIEDWLNHMAAQGYALGEWPGFTFCGRVPFLPDPEAPKARYRLDPIGKGETELRERAAGYRQQGWRYVTKIGRLYAVFRCDDPDAPDLYTDRESLGWAMKRLIRRQWLALPLTLLWAAVVLWDEIAQLPLLPMHLILYFDQLFPLYLLLFAAVAGTLICAVNRTLRLTALRRKLLAGERPAPGPKTYSPAAGFLAALVFFLLVILFSGLALGRQDSPSHPLGQAEDWPFPHVTLREILPAGTELKEYRNLELIYPDTASASLLAPEQYRTMQASLARLPGEISRQAQLYQEYIHTRTPLLARWVYEGKVWEQRQELEGSAFFSVSQEAVSHPGLDALTRFSYQLYGEDWPRACYVGLLEDQVFVLSVRGPELERPLELLAQRLA